LYCAYSNAAVLIFSLITAQYKKPYLSIFYLLVAAGASALHFYIMLTVNKYPDLANQQYNNICSS
jgi:general stress protein CsbA